MGEESQGRCWVRKDMESIVSAGGGRVGGWRAVEEMRREFSFPDN